MILLYLVGADNAQGKKKLPPPQLIPPGWLFLSSFSPPSHTGYIPCTTRCATKRDLGRRPTEAIMEHRRTKPVVECGQDYRTDNRYSGS